MPYVLSRLAANQEYVIYDLKTANGIPRAKETITVLGGAGVADNKTLITPLGVVTPVTQAQATALKEHPVFKQHLENKVVELTTKKPEEAAAPDNLAADPASQVTPEDYKAEGKEAPKTGEPKE